LGADGLRQEDWPAARRLQGEISMKRFFVLLTLVSLVMPFAVGCEKKKEATPAAAPAEGAPAAAPADAPADAK
jgi:hypothetical protein